MTEALSEAERSYLLELARASIRCALEEHRPPEPALGGVPPGCLDQPRACFVTLTMYGVLRGCTGTIEAREPLAEAVAHSAISTALYDYRFDPLSPEDLPHCRIEISVLTQPQPFRFASPRDLLEHLDRHHPGVILNHGPARATFLPQVWEKLPDAQEFLEHLCAKAGLRANAWRDAEILLYDVEMFEEKELPGEKVTGAR